MKWVIVVVGWLVVGSVLAQDIHTVVQHHLTVDVQPERQWLSVKDQITLPKAQMELLVDLHSALSPRFSTVQSQLEAKLIEENSIVKRYRLKLPASTTVFNVEYEGRIFHQLSSSRTEQARGFRQTQGIIDDQGVFLSASSYWYPQLESYPYMTYSLRVDLPQGWSSVSQGRRIQHQVAGKLTQDHWQIDKPQEEIYLIAAPFTEYNRRMQRSQGTVMAQVFLRKPDQALADKYLEATVGYLKMYEKLLGPYLYSKFALVENFWETGFGMPSFTLLGPRVIRLPFILNSSYPHEILHNWWGNGVYVDFASGNWSEGLTAYLADHLIKQQLGQDSDYRQQSLQKYRDYAANNRDLALTKFRGRHSSATEAVGYGKAMMLFHMLRIRLGDEKFIQALRQFYQLFQLRIASWNDLQQVFEQVAGEDLDWFFSQWLERSGAPALLLEDTHVTQHGDRYVLDFSLQQTQAADVYQLDIPVAISVSGDSQARQPLVHMDARRQTFSLELEQAPTRIDIDSQFDLFRQLAIAETPPAFTQLFGAGEMLVVLPSQAAQDMKPAWQAFAKDLSHMGPERVEIVWDNEINALPSDRAVSVLGWGNRFSDQLQRELADHPVRFESDQLKVEASSVPKRDHAFAMVTRINSGKGPDKAVARALITADRPDALPGLGRKLPHYHKYSYLAFAGAEPENQLKGRWPVSASPMTKFLKPNALPASLRDQPPLIEAESQFDAEPMMRTIRVLSDEKLRGRGFGSKGLNTAADYIARAFQQAGLKPGGDHGSYFQDFTAKAGNKGESAQLKNVIAVIPGRHPSLAKQNVVIGAHYDHLGLGWPDVRGDNKGKIHPGADDNGSGVAVLIELARTLSKTLTPDRNLVFVAFSGEEVGRVGSRYYAKHAKDYPLSATIAMLNLDTVGRLYDRKLMVLGSESASEWPHIFRGIGFVTGIQSVMVSEPLDASDQISFQQAGVPAVQLFSGPNADYHRPGDTADKIDVDGLVKVAEVGKQVVEYLASREQPLTSHVNAGGQSQAQQGSARRVSLGSIPDFTYQGPGYRLDGVVPESPAQQAGLKKSDIILRIDSVDIQGIRDMSTVLKSLQPGQQILITFMRDGATLKTKAMLKKR